MKKLTKQEVFETINLIDYGNNTSHEYNEYGNFIYKNIITNSNETVIKIYKADADDDIRKITTLTLLV